MANGEFSISYMDRRLKSSTQRLNGAVLTAGNIVAQSGLWAALATDTDALSAGSRTRYAVGNVTPSIATAPTATNALRKNKLAVSYHDTTTGRRFTTQIPVADGTGMNFIGDSDQLDLSGSGSAAVTTYVTDFQAVVKSADGNSVAIDKIRAIGRHTKR